MQISALCGIYGLSLLTLFWAALPAAKSKNIISCGILSFCAVIAFGGVRLLLNPTIADQENNIVRIVQPNIPQEQKWNNDEEWRNLEKYIRLTAEKGTIDPTIIVWPETAITADLQQFPEIARYISLGLPPQSKLIAGSLRVVENKGQYSYFNSVSLLDKSTKVLGTYDKHHLVPFGEYIPFRNKLQVTPIALAVSGVGDFTAGDRARTLHASDTPAFSPLICYEVIFPGVVIDKNDRPAWIVNATNDAWYGRTAGPYQHFAITRMRAIEEGLPLARAANTGISAMIDPAGRVIARQDLGATGFIDSILPAALPQTPYARYGDVIFFFIILAFLPFLQPRKIP